MNGVSAVGNLLGSHQRDKATGLYRVEPVPVRTTRADVLALAAELEDCARQLRAAAAPMPPHTAPRVPAPVGVPLATLARRLAAFLGE